MVFGSGGGGGGGGNTCPRITCVVIDCVCVCFLVTVFGDYVCVLGGGGGCLLRLKRDKILIAGIDTFLFINNEISCHASRHPLLDSHQVSVYQCTTGSGKRENV
jgi:hypothetical protein